MNMTDKEKISTQRQFIEELTKENESLKANYSELMEKYNDLSASKEELEIELAHNNQEVKQLIEKFQIVSKDMDIVTKEYREAKDDYVKTIGKNKKKFTNIINKMKSKV